MAKAAYILYQFTFQDPSASEESDFKSSQRFAQHMDKKTEGTSDFAKSKSIREQRQYLPIYAVKEEVRSKKITNTTTCTKSTQSLHQPTAASTWWCGPPPRFGCVEMAVRLSEGSSYPRHSPSFFRYAAP